MRPWLLMLIVVLVSGVVASNEVRTVENGVDASQEVNNEENVESAEDSISSEEGQNITITWAEDTDRFAYNGIIIDLNLFKIEQNEECYLITPENVKISIVELEKSPIEGVIPHESSLFVSCRVTIGPIEETLLGNWTIIALHEKDDVIYKRRHSANIQYGIPNSPNNVWTTTPETAVNSVVHFGGSLTPNMLGDTAESCHVITPNGEDLLIKEDSHYPNITRLINSQWVCTIQFSPIHGEMLGDWIFYGIYRWSTSRSIRRRPLHLFVYDEENPYSQAYNKTYLDPKDRVVNLGSTIQEEVTGTGAVDSCHVITAEGKQFDLEKGFSFNGITLLDTGNTIACRIDIGPLTKEMMGEWTLIGKFSNRNVFTERKQKFHIIQEDPANPIEDDRRQVSYENHQFINTKLEESHLVVFEGSLSSFNEIDSCHLRTSSGLQYKLMDGFNVPGVEIVTGDRILCGVNITLISEDIIGNWTLIIRETRWSTDLLERRLPFTIYVEEYVNTLPREEAVVAEGNDFYIRLQNPTNLHATCELTTPSGQLATDYEFDSRYVESCGFIVRNVSPSDSGIWEIVYGPKVIYRAPLRLNVQRAPRPITNALSFVRDRPVNLTIGPVETIYCRVENSKGFTVFNGFSICRIIIDRVTDEHAGIWKLTIGLPGHIVTMEHDVRVTIVNHEPRPIVTTHVEKQQPNIFLSCAVSSPHEISSCKFRDPQSRDLMTSHGLGEDRYTFHGTGLRVENGMYHMDCGLKIMNPSATDLGIWRCAMESEHETYFGFLTVICPWAMQDPNVAAMVKTEPKLSAARTSITGLAKDNLALLCSVSAPIRYCYFRSANGTVISLMPSASSDRFEYIGSGLDAGECGMRLTSASPMDSGDWTCNVGLSDTHETEQRDTIILNVQERLITRQYLLADFSMIVSGDLAEERNDIEYCRFVRPDGFGFTLDSLPHGYSRLSSSTLSSCAIMVYRPTTMDRRSWIVATKIMGQDEEITAVTSSISQSPIGYSVSSLIAIYFSILFLAILLIVLGVMMIPTNNRRKTFARAASISKSVRNSFRKKPIDNNSNNNDYDHSTARAA